MRKRGQIEDELTPDRADDSADASPRHSHIRELALPALKSVARFLSLDSYRSLPKHDRLPDLSLDEPSLDEPSLDEPRLDQSADTPVIPAAGSAPADGDPAHSAPDASGTSQAAGALLDWDELEIEDLAPTPYRRYLFDLRIQGYLQQTRRELSQFLLPRNF